MAWFYEIRTSDNAVLKRECGFVSRESAVSAAREDAKIVKLSRQKSGKGMEKIMVGQTMEKPTRY